MTKGEFLIALRRKLTGEIPPQEVEKHLMYYETYIANGVKQGKTEEAVVDELGSPLLIAKTIIDMQGTAKNNSYEPYNEENHHEKKHAKGPSVHNWNLNGWVLMVILLLVLSAVFALVRVLLPIVLPLLLIYFILSMLRNRS